MEYKDGDEPLEIRLAQSYMIVCCGNRLLAVDELKDREEKE